MTGASDRERHWGTDRKCSINFQVMAAPIVCTKRKGVTPDLYSPETPHPLRCNINLLMAWMYMAYAGAGNGMWSPLRPGTKKTRSKGPAGGKDSHRETGKHRKSLRLVPSKCVRQLIIRGAMSGGRAIRQSLPGLVGISSRSPQIEGPFMHLSIA